MQVSGLSVALGGRPVLDGVDLSVLPGWTAIVGPNGAGKSTLLRTLAGLQVPQAGTVELQGRSVHRMHVVERARHLAWLAQQGHTTGELTVRETVGLGRIAQLGLLGTPGPADAAVVAQAMALTECAEWAQRRLQQLSGGERQRVLLARALATEAPLLLLDEPTTHLDAPHQVALARLFDHLARDSVQPRSIVTVLHDLPIALRADRVIVLAAGRVVTQGAPFEAGVRRALEEVFQGAIRIEVDARGRSRVELALDEPQA
ncbi:ABC transporter ATP-binding protein [Azohydromonas lata]|uniref:ABC transporter ATP-binding protein n=2 Tax=Azohydromonas lata TaxID=45677 RepID=A0ABU5IH87_9BURK|nr:ABC transporter ATP-binding protein [Azohydromonas lata]MDZ5458507.1 ABC transporter ATP-binding protein [Azohydromonas lata]